MHSASTATAFEMFDIAGGAQPPKSEFVYSPQAGYVRFLQIRDFETDAHPTFIQSSSRWRFCTERDTLIGRYGAAVGRICRGLSGAYNVALVKVIPRPGVDPDYLHYLLRSAFFQGPLIAASGRSAQAGFNKDDLKVINLPVLPREQQIDAGWVLSTLDDKIELNRRMNETLEAMAQAIFRDWFVDFGPVRRKMEGATDPVAIMGGLTPDPARAAELAALFPAALGENELPVGWRSGTASDLIEFNPAEPLRKGALAPYLEMAALPVRGPSADQPVERAFGSGMRFRNGDALLARITPCLENGKACFVDNLPPNAVGWGSTEFFVLRAKAPAPAALGYLLCRDPDFRATALQSMTGTSGRQRAQIEMLKAFPIAQAPKPVLAAFGALITPPFDRVAAASAENHTLAETRDYLLPRLMSGAVRVGDAQLQDAAA